MGTIGIRMSTTIHIPEIHIHIIPRPQPIGTVGTEPTAIIDIIITTVTKLI
jgi:hypothetical protein